MKNINILQIITAIMAVFSNRNFFSKMNKCKNIVKFFICGFAIVGLTACGDGGGSSGNSTDTANPLQTQTLTFGQSAYSATAGGDTIQANANGDGTGDISYTIDNTDIATINDNGVITPLTIGTATITATIAADSTYNTATATATLTVGLGLTQTLVFEQSSYDATAQGDTIQVSASGEGTGTISYSIANTDIANINASTGVITPLTAGQTTITATIAADTTYDTAEATADIIVALAQQNFAFDEDSYSGTALGNTIQVNVTHQGTGTVSYTTASTDIATIDDNGVITPLTAGKTTVTATIDADNTYAAATATAQLNVLTQRSISLAPATFISLDAANDTAQITIASNGSTDDAIYASANDTIATVSNSGVVTAVAAGEVVITATLPQDNTHSNATATIQVCVSMVDCDSDGLIEINSLTKLHNMRFGLSGDSYKTSAGDSGVTEGCPDSGCFGYELTTNLDFDANGNGSTWSGDSNNGYTLDVGDNNALYFPIDSASDNSAGWMPIGDNNNPFTATFNGNGYTISNLAIRRAEKYIGFFGYISGATVRAIGLIDNLADYAGTEGNIRIGGLIGYSNNSTVIASYATGQAKGSTGHFDYVGGLIGWSDNNNTVIACYASGEVDDAGGNNNRVGGLIGSQSVFSSTVGSYASGNVDDGTGGNDQIGGLIGGQSSSSSTVGSYASGNVYSDGDNEDLAGRLFGFDSVSSSFTESYGFGTVENFSAGTHGTDYPSEVSDATDLAGDSDDAATYAGDTWNSAAEQTLNAWDFGTSTQPPALKYADYDGPAGTAYSCGDGSNDTFSTALCGTLIPGQR